MFSADASRHAAALRTMLDAGTLPDVGPVDLFPVRFDALAQAVRFALAEIDRVAREEQAGNATPLLWRMVDAHIECLWLLVTLATTRPRTTD